MMGCTSTTVVPQLQSNLPVAVPTAQPMTLQPVDWQVLSLGELRQQLAKLPKDSTVVFVLDGKNYNNLSLNLIEIERYIKEQKTIIELLDAIIAERAKLKQNK